VDDAEREALVSSVFDAAQDFVSSYNFTSLVESPKGSVTLLLQDVKLNLLNLNSIFKFCKILE
jgi:hypothetical protein